MKRMVSGLVLAGLLTCAGMASAATPLGGLAVAVSPSGDVLVAGGDNRALLVIDPAKMETTSRAWLGVSILALEFNKDGSRLLVEDTDGTVHLVDAKTWQVLKAEKKAAQMAAAPGADLVAVLDADYNGNVVRVLAMTDLAEKGKAALPKGQKVAALGLNADGTKLAVLMESVADEGEPKETKVPADLKGAAAEEFRTNNDGKTSQFVVFTVPAMEKAAEHKLNYSPSVTGARILFSGDNALVVNYSNVNASVAPDGKVTVFQLGNSYNYGIGWSADQKVLLSGGLSEGTLTKLPATDGTTFKPDKLPSWPEYFKSFAVAPDGTAYGATSAFRVIRVKPDGGFDKGFPAY